MSTASDQQFEALRKYITTLEKERDFYRAQTNDAVKQLAALRRTVQKALETKS